MILSNLLRGTIRFLYSFILGGLGAIATCAAVAYADTPISKQIVIESKLVHLRNDAAREWSSFPATADSTHLEVRFAASKNDGEFALRLRQQDVKQLWRVQLNKKSLGELVRDEGDMVVYLPVPAGTLVDGENVLRIESTARGASNSDDIRVGEIRVVPRDVRGAIGEANLAIEILDANTHAPLPARLTIVDANGSLQTVAGELADLTDKGLGTIRNAVRPGVVYTANGRAEISVPAGKYTIFAGRGFEYSLAKADVTVATGTTSPLKLMIHREVPTPGYVACDTHIHTFTNSGHGDVKTNERMITLAGEAIELPIATDHNVYVDYETIAKQLGVRKYFTPVVGVEVTTSVGHFNAFPASAKDRVPDHKPKEWAKIFDNIFATPAMKVAILNHARDIHSGVRPFGPRLFNAAIGENIEGWPMRFNGMEVINSGATLTDPMRLFHDWMAVLNRGYYVTPVGSSDSHDVSRYIVGQGRTYIRCDDSDVGNLDVNTAVANFLAGRVLVSYGLLTELTVNGKYRSGEIAALSGDEVDVKAQVLGPHWVEATRIELYANGQLIREEKITSVAKSARMGVKWEGSWTIPRPKHDVHLVAIATGPGIDGLYWPTAKPYQPTSPDWEARVIGASGAIWLDADGNGRRSSARDYADRIFAATGAEPIKLLATLGPYDAAVASQAAHLYRLIGGSLESDEFTVALKTATPHVVEGFLAYRDAWRENERARVQE